MTKVPDPKPYPWRKEYEVNNEMYDDQTHKFLGIINLMKALVADGPDKTGISEVFFQLVHYFEKYMMQEEIYLKELEYDRLERHIKVHREFADRIISFREGFENGNTGFEVEMYEYIEKFFDDHLMIDNRRAASFIKDNRSSK